jgi:flagellar basal body-associated protein FliL
LGFAIGGTGVVSHRDGKHKLQGEQEYETEPASDVRPVQGRRLVAVICVGIMLVWVGGGAAFLWFGSTPKSFPDASLRDFEEYRQEIAKSQRRDHEMLQALDAEIKRLSDQVSQLTTEMASLESRARDAQAAIALASQKAGPKKPAAKPPTSTAPLLLGPEDRQ